MFLHEKHGRIDQDDEAEPGLYEYLRLVAVQQRCEDKRKEWQHKGNTAVKPHDRPDLSCSYFASTFRRDVGDVVYVTCIETKYLFEFGGN